VASITNDNGRRIIQFHGADGKRRSLRLGKVSERQAQAVQVKVEDLAAAAVTGHPPQRSTSQWVAELSDAMHGKLAAVKLVPPRQSARLGAFIDSFIGNQAVKSSTRLTYARARGHLIGFFGEDRDLRSITAGDADDWWAWMLSKRTPKLSENTARKSVSIARQIMRAATRKKLIEDDPFAHLAGTVKPNRSRDHFVTRDEAQRVLDACPDSEWRLMFALARFGGLRIPSEAVRLRWNDVDWERERFTVHSPKTEHHDGGASRVVPIFPELLQHFRTAFDQAAEGAEFCIARHRSPAVNLRTHLLRIIKRAGLTPWPKLWQNLRSTRETELANDFPIQVVTAWIGHKAGVAVKHYLQVTDDHFSQAVQNPVQQPHVTDCNAARPIRGEESQVSATADFGDDSRLAAVSCSGAEEGSSGRYRTRTCDLIRVKDAL
jgi:integrase